MTKIFIKDLNIQLSGQVIKVSLYIIQGCKVQSTENLGGGAENQYGVTLCAPPAVQTEERSTL